MLKHVPGYRDMSFSAAVKFLVTKFAPKLMQSPEEGGGSEATTRNGQQARARAGREGDTVEQQPVEEEAAGPALPSRDLQSDAHRKTAAVKSKKRRRQDAGPPKDQAQQRQQEDDTGAAAGKQHTQAASGPVRKKSKQKRATA